jgi:hypothetical protein
VGAVDRFVDMVKDGLINGEGGKLEKSEKETLNNSSFSSQNSFCLKFSSTKSYQIHLCKL